jgi:hypothetical protein
MKKYTFSEYDKKIHHLGFITTFITVLAMLAVPLLTQIIFHLNIDAGVTIKTFFTALTVFGPVAICEFLSYLPLLGAGGLYIAFVTGNVMNMKLPAATNAQKVAGVEAGTPEAEAISALAAAVSTITTMVILTAGMILTAQILHILKRPIFAPAFSNITAAIFSAIALPTFVKSVKTASLPVALTVLLTIVLSYQVLCAPTRQFYVLPAFLIFKLLWEYVRYRKGKKE